MAHILRVTDGTTTASFTTGDMYLLDYVPRASMDDEPLREQATVGFTNTLTIIRGNINKINRLFTQAASYWRNQTGEKVYLEFDPGSSGTVYRSQLYGGVINLTDETLHGQWGAANLELELEWTRQPFWEGPLTQLPLSNASATDNTSGITVNNADDSHGDNWVSIDGVNDVLGDLPAPIKVQMYNSYVSAQPADEIYIFHNVYSAPGSITHVLEAENGTGASVVSTTEGTPGSSEDKYAAIVWSTTAETKIVSFVLSSALLTSAGGGRFAVLARWNAAFPYTDMWLRLKLESATASLWNGGLSKIGDTRELHWLDTLRLPPYLSGQSSLKAANLALYGKRATAGTHTLNLDYLHLSPISGDNGWKRFRSVDAGIAYQEYLIHDDTEGIDYRIDTSGSKIAEFTVYGGPILLVPGVDQKLYFLSCDNNGLALVEQTWTVKLWYRPRRNSL